MGELHITGFSNYLQPLNGDYLIGLGREADPNTGRAQELQISLFDVSDLSSPALADRYTFNVPDWAWSEAISDHHAVGYYPEHQVLAIPVSNGSGWVTVDRNGDGRVDLVVHVATADIDPALLQEENDAVYAVLTGSTYGGKDIEGADEIIVVPVEK